MYLNKNIYIYTYVRFVLFKIIHKQKEKNSLLMPAHCQQADSTLTRACAIHMKILYQFIASHIIQLM
jgi:hypothetical protein